MTEALEREARSAVDNLSRIHIPRVAVKPSRLKLILLHICGVGYVTAMPNSNDSDDSSIIDIDDAPPTRPPAPPRYKRLKPPSARAILELGDRDFRKPPAPVVKCHILGVAVMHDLLKVSGFVSVLFLSALCSDTVALVITCSISSVARASLSPGKRGGKLSAFSTLRKILF